MDSKKITSDYILICMKNLNLLVIIYIAFIISYSLSGYIRENSAFEFLSALDTIPVPAWKIPVLVILLYGCCLLLMHGRTFHGAVLAVKVCLEIGISLCISYLLGFSYSGMLLLILANTMSYFPKSQWKFSFAITICLFYMLADYDFIASKFNSVSLEVYLGYFLSTRKSFLLGIKNTMNSLNTFIFLLYMIQLVRVQTNETERIQGLNEQLSITNKELFQANLRLEEYAKESVKMAETRERNRLAREIHDTLGHALTGIIMGLQACIALMDTAPEAAKNQLKTLVEVAGQGMTDVRRSVKALRPDALEKFNLQKALISLIEETGNTTHTEIEYQCSTNFVYLNENEEEVVYRIIQESITNAIRHGKASRIQIFIHREVNELKISVIDNGIGCLCIKEGFGLHHMKERIDLLHGNLEYYGENGFELHVAIPIRWGTEAAEND